MTSDPQQAYEPRTQAPAADEGAGDTAVSNLDKVRELLFGGHMRDYDRRFASLEERLVRETGELRDEVRRRLASLEEFVKRETEALADRIRGEHDARAGSHEELARQLRESSSALERKAAGLDDQLARAQRELRQQILDQDQRLSDDIRRRVEDVLARVTQESTALRSDKADRATIASLLTEMAMRLNNELSIPGLGEGRNG